MGWPPVRSYRKNVMGSYQKPSGGTETAAFVKVSMDGAPYLRKVDLKMYKSYDELSNALSNMFSSFTMGTLYKYVLLDIRFHAYIYQSGFDNTC